MKTEQKCLLSPLLEVLNKKERLDKRTIKERGKEKISFQSYLARALFSIQGSQIFASNFLTSTELFKASQEGFHYPNLNNGQRNRLINQLIAKIKLLNEHQGKTSLAVLEEKMQGSSGKEFKLTKAGTSLRAPLLGV